MLLRMRRVRTWGIPLFVMALGALVPRASGAEAEGPCKSCNPKSGSWDWKANGYAVAMTADAAREGAIARALDSGCPTSYRYLEGLKLHCAAGCTPGELIRECKPKGTPGCDVARYDEHQDQWTFVCRKANGKLANQECTKAAAQALPFYSMCDVPMVASVTLPCAAPTCATAP